ncbi:MAG: putative homocitrate synthase AksA [Candidatus Woesearchaeota archaeon]|nr:putative homocitrate synthase AksA [Candidatus Woesearchaeota archaeon]
MSRIQILDSTLREGEQTPGVYFDTHIMLAIATLLDKIGIDFIEAGHPIVWPEIKQGLTELTSSKLNSVIAAHSRTLKKDIDEALDTGVGFIGIFYCVSEERLNGVYKKDINQVLEQISETVAYAKRKNSEVIIRYTPEDTVRSEFENVVKASVAAVKAGADIISIADTTGYMVPGTDRNMYDYVLRLKSEFEKQGINPKIAVHCHNDRGFALANAIDAYRAGVDIIDASVLSLGERAGIVDLAQLLNTLYLDFGEEKWDLSLLDKLYCLVSQYSGVPIPVNTPLIGDNAFTHCAGVHSQAAIQNPVHYQSIPPDLYGKEQKICLDHMSGRAAVHYMLSKIGHEESSEEDKLTILRKVKEIGTKGRVVDEEELRHIVEWNNSNGGGKN